MGDEPTLGNGMTIDDLARRSGLTTRSIRAYQAKGLLPSPTLRGRVGIYGDHHLARLRVIPRLQHQGFTLAGIAELLRAWEDGRGLADVLGVEEEHGGPSSRRQPWVDPYEPETLTRDETRGVVPRRH